ncbi:hypothetical protein ACWDOP_11000 [Nocardia sp. NPDC003693]
MNQPLPSQVPPTWLPPRQDPERIARFLGALSALGTLNAVQSLVDGYDELVKGTHIASRGIDWESIGAKVAIALSLMVIALLCAAMVALCRHRSGVRVLVPVAAVFAVAANVCEELFEWLHFNQMIDPAVESRVIAAVMGSILPFAAVVLVTRPALRQWFVPVGATWRPLPRPIPTGPAPHLDPVAPSILAGVAAALGVLFAVPSLAGAIDSHSDSYPVALTESILGVLQLALLGGGALAVVTHHRLARPLIAAGAAAAMSRALTGEIAQWGRSSDYQTLPKQFADFCFDVGFQAGPAVAAAVLILTPQAAAWFSPRESRTGRPLTP